MDLVAAAREVFGSISYYALCSLRVPLTWSNTLVVREGVCIRLAITGTEVRTPRTVHPGWLLDAQGRINLDWLKGCNKARDKSLALW
jgi:hypothetical protein